MQWVLLYFLSGFALANPNETPEGENVTAVTEDYSLSHTN